MVHVQNGTGRKKNASVIATLTMWVSGCTNTKCFSCQTNTAFEKKIEHQRDVNRVSMTAVLLALAYPPTVISSSLHPLGQYVI